MEKRNNLRGEDRRVVSTKLYKVEFNLLDKICKKEGKSVHAKLRELVRNEVDEKMSGALEKKEESRFKFKDILIRHKDPYWAGFLINLGSLAQSASSVFNNKQIIDKIKNDPFTAKWEFELIGYFKKRGVKVLDSEISTFEDHNVDFKIMVSGSEVLVEAGVQFLKEKEINGYKATFAPIDALIPLRVANKVKQNRIDICDLPAILALDGTYAGLDHVNLLSCVDKEIKECISGILLKTNNGIRFLENRGAKHKLTKNQVEELVG